MMKHRNRKTVHPAITPITRAVRLALAASATMVALTLPASALAVDGCRAEAATMRCDFAPVHAVDAPLDDPSLVVAGAVPASVQAGFAALLATAFESGVVVTDPEAAHLENDGEVVVAAHASGDASAYGAIAGSDAFSDLANTDSGVIDVIADSVDGTALAVGAYAYAGVSASIWNYGAVSAEAHSAYGDAQAYAAVIAGVPAGIGLLVNGGSLEAQAVVDAGGAAHATGAYVVADVGTVFNDASISASATTGAEGIAVARGAAVYARYAAAYSYGDVVVEATGGLSAAATGIDVHGFYGAAAYNAGAIEADARADGEAYAIGSSAIATVFGAYSSNYGSITASADGASAGAIGVLNASLGYGDAITVNGGDIAVTAIGGIAAYGEAEATAQGIYNLAAIYASAVYNSGAITATALAMADISGTYGFLQAKAVGAQATSLYGYGDTVMANAGDIDAVAMTSQGYASAWGAVALTSGRFGGTAVLDNHGSISAYAYADIGVANAIGAYALDQFGDVEAVNYGDIVASARVERGIPYVSVNYAYAIGLKAASYYGAVGIDNHADIVAFASGAGAIVGARGIQAGGANIAITNAEGASVRAIGEVDVFGGGFATGIEANGIYGIDIVNDGDIDVYGHAHAYGYHYGAAKALGIYAAAGFQGDVSVANNGSISAIALAEDSLRFFQGGAGATGIHAYAKYDATIVNTGDVTASARSEFGITAAYGVIGHGKYYTHVDNAAGASIQASAMVGSLEGDNYGGRAISFGTHVFGNGMEHGVITNAGSIVSHAASSAESANLNPGLASAWGASIGAYSNVLAGTVVNLGDIEAAASADFSYATAYGAFVQTGFDSVISNAGTIHAGATAIEGNAFAVGGHAFARHETRTYICTYHTGPYGEYRECDYANPVITVDGGESLVENGGDIIAMASAEGGVGYSYGAAVFGAFSADLLNTGTIRAATEAEDARATGALVSSVAGDAGLTSSGDILASASGATAYAIGAKLLGADGALVDNGGRILAGAYGADATAIGVWMGATGSNVLTNAGTIAAFGDGARIAVWSGAGASASIANHGSLIGAVVTGDLDDSLVNAAGASWLVLGESDFGDGDDAIANHGSIRMQDAGIALGSALAGNAFDNFGNLLVSGGNAIDMGGDSVFRNAGAISFVDGATDDVLNVIGGFGGSGQLSFDADLSSGSGDRLLIAGDVAGASVQTIHANIFGLPTSAHERIALVGVDGTLGGSFVLGNAHYTGVDFLAMGFGLAKTAETVWLQAEVLGLDDAGSLAASVASGAANFLNSQVGTFRQRLGVDPYGDAGKVMSAFVRFYSEEGDLTPQHSAVNFGQGGHFDFNQSSWGREIGVNANLSGKLHAGLVLGTADSRQRLIHGGLGESRMDGTTVGAYATWYAPDGLYVDLSGRWMAADVQMTSASGMMTTRSHAAATSVEAGYQLALGGMRIVPQLQYTRTEVEGIRTVQGARVDFQSQGGRFARGRLGVEFNTDFEAGQTRITPYASINALREFDGKTAYTVADTFMGGTSLRGSSLQAELGMGVQRGGFGFNLGASWIRGGAFDGFVGGQAGLRYSW